MPHENLIWGAVAAGGLLGAALCSGTEMGMYCINRVKLSLRAAAAESAKGKAGARVDRAALILKRELEKPGRALATLLIGTTLFGDVGATALTAILERAGFSEIRVALINLVIFTPLLFVFAETLPKEVFRARADRLTYRMAPFLAFLRWSLTYTGVLPLMRWLTQGIAAAFGVKADETLGSARDKMAALLKEGARHGVLSDSQTSLLDRALAMGETQVGDEMVPWSKVKSLSLRMTQARMMEVFRATACSRYPVVDGQGRVVGTVELIEACLSPGKPLADLLQPPLFLDPDMPVRQALVAMRTASARIGIVQRPGQSRPTGIVTAKDLVEPLTGELVAW